jgi:hypothetical protein
MTIRDISHDIDLYVTVIIAFVVGLLGVLDVVSVGVLVSATLASMALASVGSFVGRRQVAALAASTAELSTLVRVRELDTPSADRLLSRSTSGLDIEFFAASDIRLMGVTLSRTMRNHLLALEGRLQSGALVRIAVIEPGSAAVLEAARRSAVPDSPEIFENRLRSTIDLTRRLAMTPGITGRIEVRVLPFVPAFGLILVDPDGDGGRVVVDIYSHRSAVAEPTFGLRPHHDPRWYRHFLQEFDRVWASGRLAGATDGFTLP